MLNDKENTYDKPNDDFPPPINRIVSFKFFSDSTSAEYELPFGEWELLYICEPQVEFLDGTKPVEMDFGKTYTITTLSCSVGHQLALIPNLQSAGRLTRKTGQNTQLQRWRKWEPTFHVDESGCLGDIYQEDGSRCDTVDCVWWIGEGVGFAQPTLLMVESATQDSPITVTEGMHVLVMNGSIAEPTLIVASHNLATAQHRNVVVDTIIYSDSWNEL
ncbi:hypothetical protein BLNAU_14351 [Blattamonas nauphoetae]|uniref:Uncharacterized protein n=1 Tax=Blattamonas nauphoetae TaxID=2049346 RepID=A0ABQ9XKM3_9EUKA|nr:hypothetical protein BLNAU_14351 [Blattamonas nauphoetae]